MNTLQVSDFPAYFQALWGRPPFPWQTRLLVEVAESGKWPKILDLPTGSGKTAALDIAVFWLALDAQKPAAQRQAPRRIFLIVNRRVIVDQADERGKALAKMLYGATEGVLLTVADWLRTLTGEPIPLRTAVMRGGIPMDDSWAHRPDQPVIISSTVDQFGSRLLFRGYGISPGMTPIHTGLVAQDALILLDEVHLSGAFFETLQVLDRYYMRPTEGQLPMRWQWVSMSATVNTQHLLPSGVEDLRVFSLDAADLEPLAPRIGAAKPIKLTSLEPTQALHLTTHVVRSVKRALGSGRRAVGVIVNRVATARSIWSALKEEEFIDLLLVTGRMRALDKLKLKGTLDRVQSGAYPASGKPVVVVSTQSLEAGADLDFDCLITELAPIDALRQRFGRLNRLGLRERCDGELFFGHHSDDDPIYGGALVHTLQELEKWADANHTVDFGISSINGHMITAPIAEMMAPSPSALPLLPSAFRLLTYTQPRPSPDPVASHFLHGLSQGNPEVRVIWRHDLSEELLQPAGEQQNTPRELIKLVGACPPSSLEAMSLPIAEVKRWLTAVPEESNLSDLEVTPTLNDSAEPRRKARPFLLWKGDDSITSDATSALYPEATILVPASYGGVNRAHNWDPASTDPVTDLGDRAAWLGRHRAVLRTSGFPTAPPIGEEDTSAARKRAEREWLRALADSPSSSDTKQIATHILKVGWVSASVPSMGDHVVIMGKKAKGRRDFIPGSQTAHHLGEAVTLRKHSEDVAQWAVAFAEKLGLSDAMIHDLRFAALHHDLGKRDPRFQLLLTGGDPIQAALLDEPLAKSGILPTAVSQRWGSQAESAWPKGNRHECLSVSLLENSEFREQVTDWDLVLHLIGSHHGWCRPFAPAIVDPSTEQITVNEQGVTLSSPLSHTLARLDSGTAERFSQLNEKYGPYGLAWLEAIFRLADHRASEEEQGGKA